MKKRLLLVFALVVLGASNVLAQESKPNILVIFGDDIGQTNVSAYSMGLMEQRSPGTLNVWAEPFTVLRVPKLYDLHADPYERADITSNTYYDWFLSKAYLMVGAQLVAGQFLETFEDFPPSQRAATFTIDQAMDKLKHSIGN